MPAKSYMGCDMVRRADGRVNVWMFMLAVQEWQVVHVAPTMRSAHNWIYNNIGKGR
jgi:hypothetical protein